MPLRLNDIQEILRDYGLGRLIRARKAEHGMCGHNWICTTDSGTYVLRATHSSSTPASVKYEQRFITSLAKNGFPYQLPVPLKSLSGRTIVKKKGRLIWLYKFLRGIQTTQKTLSRHRSVGRVMAQLHLCTKKIRIGQRPGAWSCIAPGSVLPELAKAETAIKRKKLPDLKDKDFIRTLPVLRDALSQINDNGYSSLPRIPVHADIHYGNLLFSGNNVTGLLDFESAQVDSRMRDISTFLHFACHKPDGSLNVPLALAFLGAYHSVFPITLREFRYWPQISIHELACGCWWYWQVMEHDPRPHISLSDRNKLLQRLRWYVKNQRNIARILFARFARRTTQF